MRCITPREGASRVGAVRCSRAWTLNAPRPSPPRSTTCCGGGVSSLARSSFATTPRRGCASRGRCGGIVPCARRARCARRCDAGTRSPRSGPRAQRASSHARRRRSGASRHPRGRCRVRRRRALVGRSAPRGAAMVTRAAPPAPSGRTAACGRGAGCTAARRRGRAHPRAERGRWKRSRGRRRRGVRARWQRGPQPRREGAARAAWTAALTRATWTARLARRWRWTTSGARTRDTGSVARWTIADFRHPQRGRVRAHHGERCASDVFRLTRPPARAPARDMGSVGRVRFDTAPPADARMCIMGSVAGSTCERRSTRACARGAAERRGASHRVSRVRCALETSRPRQRIARSSRRRSTRAHAPRGTGPSRGHSRVRGSRAWW